MNNQKPETLIIQTDLTNEQFLGKLNRITTEEFYDAIKSPEYLYYGKISGSEFDIRNRNYGPHSTGPCIKGKISETNSKVTVTVEINIEEQMEIVKKMIYPYFIFLGLLIITIGAFMGDTQLITIAVGAFLIVSTFPYVAIIKLLLKSMQKGEMKQFSAILSS